MSSVILRGMLVNPRCPLVASRLGRAALEEIRKTCGVVDGALTENDNMVRFRCEPGERVPSQFWDGFLKRRISAIEICSDERHVSIWKTSRARDLKKGFLPGTANWAVRCDDFHKNNERFFRTEIHQQDIRQILV